MKVIGEFTENSRRENLLAEGRPYVATWETAPGYVEVPGISEVAVRVDDKTGQPVVYMRWMVANLRITGDKEATLDALESHSPAGDDWAKCLRTNREQCPPSLLESGAIALLALIASPSARQEKGLGTLLAVAFAEKVLAPLGVRAFWIQPLPLVEHVATGVFKPMHAADSAKQQQARFRLEQHYERGMDAMPACPNYLRVDLATPENACG